MVWPPVSIGENSYSIWLPGWALFLAIGWLLPNHYLPWTSFHQEIFVAFVLFLIVPWAIHKMPSRFSCDRVAAGIAVAALIPAIQFFFGQIYYSGHAWVCSCYLIGLLLAIVSGRIWETSYPGRLVDFLFLAIGIASLISIFLQLSQWFKLDGLGIWLVESTGQRPSANLGQPNQLATLLLWGVLATFWGWVRSKIGPAVAIFLALVLLFGVALTASRTAWVAIVIVVFAGWWWRDLWSSKYLPWVLAAIGCYFFLCVLVVGSFGGHRVSGIASSSVDPRFVAWRMFVGAISERPWFGYGWGQTAVAHISIAENYPPLHVVFAQAHNLFLDLIIWCGVPIGGLFSLILLNRFWRFFRQVRFQEDAVLFLFLLVVANHALLEFPLHYAYFLLPAGLIVGVMIARDKNIEGVIELGKGGVAGGALACVIILSVMVIDYLKIENGYSLLRMEWAGFNLEANPKPPEVILLNQWQQVIKHARSIPKPGMLEPELEDMRRATMMAHKPIDFRLLANALALNGRERESDLWFLRMCKVQTEESCQGGSRSWYQQQ